ncbi:MAG: exodeoxyribonuclease VII small subunit [Clostridiales bacterium]|nr:exodeoxyribonuclease VII small subunit [Clostridiales bacterium]MDY3745286.1 exodeoxyribonuclease VII small subunit [Lachnospiraceae bacterium]
MAKAKSLETAFEELETTIAALESGDLSLEASFKLYADGMKLVKYCNDAIDKVEKKMIQLKAEDGEDHEF